MEKHIVQDFPVVLPLETLLKRLRIENDTEDEDCQRVAQMLAEALACARPKYAYAVAAIEAKGDDHVIVEGHRLDSALVRRNLDNVHRIIPYVATCGIEVDAWSRGITDMVEHFWADEIKQLILAQAIAELRQTVQQRYFPGSRLAGDHPDAQTADPHAAGISGRTGDMAKMSPGSLPEWPISQQTALFSLLDGLPEAVGVRLTGSCLMLPSKSVSGFFFSSETSFVNCRFCPILACPNRSARYQPEDAR